MDCEVCYINLLNYNLNVVNLYRAPQGNVKLFFEHFELAVKHLMKGEARVAICGGFIIEMVTGATHISQFGLYNKNSPPH